MIAAEVNFVPGWVIVTVFGLLISALTAMAFLILKLSERIARLEERDRLARHPPVDEG